MGVCIKGMEMPENCEKCIHLSWSNFYQIFTCNVIREEEPVIFNRKQTNSYAVVRSGRADNCPMISTCGVCNPHCSERIKADSLTNLETDWWSDGKD